MIIKRIKIPGPVLYTFTKYNDKRGVFTEILNLALIKKFYTKQINYSYSKKNVFRGFHMQKGKFAQKKYIWVSEGKIIDIVVDLRKRSKYFGKFVKVILSANKHALLIPRGFAHGFFTLAKTNKIYYIVDNKYSKKNEITLNFLDPNLKVSFSNKNKIISSPKDKKGLSLNELSKIL
jgi:dTDP-4-dehydrorhamnose 3,5-epimerase